MPTATVVLLLVYFSCSIKKCLFVEKLMHIAHEQTDPRWTNSREEIGTRIQERKRNKEFSRDEKEIVKSFINVSSFAFRQKRLRVKFTRPNR